MAPDPLVSSMIAYFGGPILLKRTGFLLLLLLLAVPLLAEDSPPQIVTDEANNLPVGPMVREQILTLEVFNYGYLHYVPKADVVEAIRSWPTPFQVVVIFGDWCSDSKESVPAFIKVMEMTANPLAQISYINIHRQKDQRAGQLGAWQITAVPTFIVLSGDKEIGRISETPKVSIEQDLATILESSRTQ